MSKIETGPLAAYAVLVPVKRPELAKSRLAELGDEVRRDLCVAFARDTIAAVLECPDVASVTVVTDDALLAGEFAELGTRVLPDGVGNDLNESLRLAAAEVERTSPGHAVAAVFADLPALRPADLLSVLAAGREHGLAFVADTIGEGSTCVAAGDVAHFSPAFGTGSRAVHLANGAVEVTGAVPTLRRDVDTPADLVEAVELGVGAHTRMALTRHRVLERLVSPPDAQRGPTPPGADPRMR